MLCRVNISEVRRINAAPLACPAFLGREVMRLNTLIGVCECACLK